MSVYLSVNMCGIKNTHYNIINIIKYVIWIIWIKSVLQVKLRLRNSFLYQILNALNCVKKVIIKISFMRFQTAIKVDVMMVVDINWILVEDLIMYGIIMITRIESEQIEKNVHQIIKRNIFIKMVFNVSMNVRMIMFINTKKMGMLILFVMIHVCIILILIISHFVRKESNVMNLVDNIHINIIWKADNAIIDVYMMERIQHGYILKKQIQENVLQIWIVN